MKQKTTIEDHDPTLAANMPPGGYPAHEIADVLPTLEGEELEELADDIGANGQRDTIVLSPDGKVIEGRNRQRAALLTGQIPRYRRFDPAMDGDSLTAFVISKNLKRRHLSPGQRAALAVEFIPHFEKEAAARRTANLPKLPKASNDAFGENGKQKVTQVGTIDELNQETGYDVANESQARPTKVKGKGKSAAQAAAKLKVSTASVERAKRAKKDDPKKFEEMKAGKKDAAAKVSEEKLEKAINRIEQVCGKPQATAIREGDLMRNRKDVVAYAALTDAKMLAIRALIDQGWSVKKATHFKAEDLLPTHTIRQAMHRAIYAGGAFQQKVKDESGDLVANVAVEVLFKESGRTQKPKRGRKPKAAKVPAKKKVARKAKATK